MKDKLGNTKLPSTSATKVAWRVLSYLASDPETQKALVQPTNDVFLKERVNVNPGANFLRGVCVVYEEYYRSLLDSVGKETETTLGNIKNTIEDMIWQKEDDPTESNWSTAALSRPGPWQSIRENTRNALALMGLHPIADIHPFEFEGLLHLDHYDRRNQE